MRLLIQLQEHYFMWRKYLDNLNIVVAFLPTLENVKGKNMSFFPKFIYAIITMIEIIPHTFPLNIF